MIALDVDSGKMSVGRIPFYCKRRCNLFASAEYYLIDTSSRFTGTIPLQYQVNLEQQVPVQKVAEMMALICLFTKCSELNKMTGSESSYFCGNDDGLMGKMGDMRSILRSSLVTGLFVLVFGVAYGQQVINPNRLPPCPREQNVVYHKCWGTFFYAGGHAYEGEWVEDKKHGFGTYTYANGLQKKGIWVDNQFVRESSTGRVDSDKGIISTYRIDIERDRQQLAEDRKQLEEEKRQQEQQAAIERQLQLIAEERHRLEEGKRQREKQRQSERVSLQVIHTQPASDGGLTITIQTNADTASLKINGSEEGGSSDGKYNIKRIARAGQTTTFNIVATDAFGNTDTKAITVSRAVVESKSTFAALNPVNIKKQLERDAAAVIIGIADYRSLPKAEFANDDARAFYDYAIRALGIKPENIKLLVDGDAEEAEILKTFRTWLPSRVKSTTEVFVFYSGHGLPMPDGKGLYLVPPRADREVIDDTAIPFSKINAALTLAKPKSVTIFLDACYSGQARSGETLVASARPVQLKSDSRYFPENFTVITASQNDQISSSNPELQHGIFSYYLMKGMEGDADENRDGKITLGEMQSYLSENVSRHAAMMSRKQEPQLIGDINRVLVGR